MGVIKAIATAGLSVALSACFLFESKCERILWLGETRQKQYVMTVMTEDKLTRLGQITKANGGEIIVNKFENFPAPTIGITFTRYAVAMCFDDHLFEVQNNVEANKYLVTLVTLKDQGNDYSGEYDDVVSILVD